MPSTQTAAQLLKGYLVDWQQNLQRWSENGRLLAAAQEALMLEDTPKKLRDLVDQWDSGGFNSIPEIVLLSAADMNGAMGAYAISAGTIYLNRDWLLTAGADAVGAVLTEELGHHLDSQLNEVDTRGDEGEYFARLLNGQNVTKNELAAHRSDQDLGQVFVGGDVRLVEQSAPGLLWSTPIATPTNDAAGRLSISSEQLVVGESVSASDGVWGQAVVEAFSRATGASQWRVSYGTADKTYIGAVAHAPDGSIFVTGGTRETLNGQIYGGAADGWISKLSSTGQVLWTKNFSNQLEDDLSNLVVDSLGNAYMAGTLSRYGYRSGSGHFLSDYNYLGGDQSYGGSSFTGNWMSAVRKVDTNGNIVWTRVDGSFNSGGALLAIDPGFRLIKSAYTFASVNGQPVVTGRDNGNGSNVCDYLISYKLDGTVEWTKMKAQVTALAADPSTHSIYVGNKNNLEKLDQSGNILWSISLGMFAQDITIDNAGGIHVITQNGTNGLRETTWSPDGLAIGSIDYSATGALGVADLQISSDGTRYLTGNITSGVLVGGDDIAQGARDGVVWAYGSQSNQAPTDITPSTSSFDENIAAASTVATLSSTDPETTDTFTYALVAGTNSADNAAFSIVGNELKINASPDFETKSSYSVRVRTTDAGGLTFEKALNLTVNDLAENGAPTDITTSASSFDEKIVAASTVATLSSTDPDAADTFTYALVAGTGSTDNAAFTIVGNQLKINASPDFETKSSYSVRVRTTDAGGLTFEKALTFNVNNVNEAPADITPSTSSFDENIAAASTVATLSSTDPDAGDTFTYALVSGIGDADNASFSISGNQLKVIASPDFETKSSYSIRLQTTDSGGLTFQKALTFNVNNLNEAPTNLSASATSFDENIPAASTVATLSTDDPDAADTFTYSFVAGDGDTDNAAFSISGNQLKVIASPDFETKSSYSVRVRTTDAGSLTFEKTLTFSVIDLLEQPVIPPPGSTKTFSGDYDFTITGTPASGRVVATQKVKVGKKTTTVTKIDETFASVLTVDITAGASANIINAQSWTGNANLKGEAGNDTITGGSGINTYTGGVGADKFRFTLKPEFTASLADHITDFSGTQKDKIEISRSAFGIGKTAKVSITSVNGSIARDAALAQASLLVYDSSTGELWWNQNGSTAGAGSGGVFAILDNKPASLAASAIALIA